MLTSHDASAIVAVTDLERARDFYGGTLGLRLINNGMGTLVFQTGTTRLIAYPSKEAGTNRANAVAWTCGTELEAIVRALQGKGVTFEQYDLPGTTFENGVHRTGSFLAAWFKDPDGNILHLNSGP